METTKLTYKEVLPPKEIEYFMAWEKHEQNVAQYRWFLISHGTDYEEVKQMANSWQKDRQEEYGGEYIIFSVKLPY